MSTINTDAVAREIFDAVRAGRQITPFSARGDGFDHDSAVAVATRLRALRGEPVVGRKIGFTNRSIWPLYGVDAPMWGDLTHTSVRALDGTPFSLSPYLEPRLEPEVALKLRTAPTPAMDERALLETVDWFAPAFEIVHSVYPGWRFTLEDCAAMGALHGALLLGPAVPNGAFANALPALTLQLFQNGDLCATGRGADVLDGPMAALRHLVAALSADGAAPLAAGDIVTTGTLTDALKVAPGAHVEARFCDTPLSTIAVTFAH
ncbi:MAG: fumarylacetoacetate hydrolase family protein [Pseudomonadota bacterium]